MNQAVSGRDNAGNKGSASHMDDSRRSRGGETAEQAESHRNEPVYEVASANGSVDLEVSVKTDHATGASTIEGHGTMYVGEDKKPVEVTVKFEVSEDGEATATVDVHGSKLSDQDAQALLSNALRHMAIDLLAVAPISNEAYQGMLAFGEGASSTVQLSSNSSGGQTITATALIQATDGLQNQDLADAEFEKARSQARSDYESAGGSARQYDGGPAGSSASVDDGVISDPALKGLAANSDFQYRSQGNVEGNYFSKTEKGIMAEVSTSDRRPGFWNGNRAEIAFNKKFRSSDSTGFRSFFDIHSGSNFSIFQLFNQVGREGFPEAMVRVVDGKLVLGGRAFGGKDVVLGALPEGQFGIDVKFSGGKVSVQLLDTSGQAVGEGYTASLTQPGGEFHYRAGPYFDGYNNKQFGSDMQNVTAKVEIIDPVMIG